MTKKLLDLSGKIDELIPIIEEITQVADSLGIPFFVIGAAARDLILKHGYGLGSSRATIDLDLAIQVENWEKYNILSAVLLETGLFSEDRSPHKFKYKEELYIDIIPFGQIQNAEGEITWPPDNETTMSVIGFDDAYENTLIVRVRTDPILDIRVVSLPGLVVLKLITWKGRGTGDNRDSKDLLFIIRNYHSVDDEERLFNENFNIMEELGHRIKEAGARLLGQDIATLIKPKTKDIIHRILDEETDENGESKLITSVVRGSLSYDEDFDEYKTLLNELKKGIYETP